MSFLDKKCIFPVFRVIFSLNGHISGKFKREFVLHFWFKLAEICFMGSLECKLKFEFVEFEYLQIWRYQGLANIYLALFLAKNLQNRENICEALSPIFKLFKFHALKSKLTSQRPHKPNFSPFGSKMWNKFAFEFFLRYGHFSKKWP